MCEGEEGLEGFWLMLVPGSKTIVCAYLLHVAAGV